MSTSFPFVELALVETVVIIAIASKTVPFAVNELSFIHFVMSEEHHARAVRQVLDEITEIYMAFFGLKCSLSLSYAVYDFAKMRAIRVLILYMLWHLTYKLCQLFLWVSAPHDGYTRNEYESKVECYKLQI